MAMNAATLNAAIDAIVPTRAQLQTTLWNALYAQGYRDWTTHPNASYVDPQATPSLKKLSDAIAGVMWDHIQTVEHTIVSQFIAHIIANQVVTSVGPDPQGGTVTSVSTVIV
jgi:hypothetical protein